MAMSPARERIIRAGEAQFDIHNEHDAGIPAIALAAACAALGLAKERLSEIHDRDWMSKAHRSVFGILDQLLTEIENFEDHGQKESK